MPGVNVVLSVDSMTCVQSTEPGRDEVYFRIHGNSSHGLFSRRLPRDDDYYEFNSDQTNNQNQHWTNQDQAPVGRPVLWAGHLDEGQGAEVVVFIAEQDNKELGVLRDIAKAALAALKAAGTFGGSPLATAALQGAEQLVDQIPDVRTHGIIGLFSFHFRNVPGGQMEFVLLPWTGFQFPGYTQGATTSRHPNSYYEAALRGDGSTEAVHLDFNGSPGGRYNAVITLTQVSQFHDMDLLELIGTTIDRCRGQQSVRVSSRGGQTAVPPDARLVRVEPTPPTNNLIWFCGNSRETRDNMPLGRDGRGPDVIYASRFPNDDGRINWACYRQTAPSFGTSRRDLRSGLIRKIKLVGMNNEIFEWEAANGGKSWPFGQIQIQDGWRWCSRCLGLWFSLNPNSRCPSGGTHSQDGSGHYFVPHNIPAAVRALGMSSDTWRHCPKCQGLWNENGARGGKCPAGGSHSSEGSGHYSLIIPGLGTGNARTQTGWHLCTNCDGLWFADTPSKGRCPSVDVVLPGREQFSGHVRQEGQAGAELLAG